MLLRIPLAPLFAHSNPFERSPWDVPVTRAAIQSRIDRQDWDAVPGSTRHLERVAYLAAHPCPKPISVSVGDTLDGPMPPELVGDGKHRYVAALFRGDADIAADVSGHPERIQRMFGVSIPPA